ncbi:hypothetical protein D3C84_735530 [compost metagenome]
MVWIHVLTRLQRTTDGANKGAAASDRQEHVFGHGPHIATHADGDDHAIAQRLVQVVSHQAGNRRALGIGVAMIDGDQCPIQLEALDQRLFQLSVQRRMLQYTHLDHTFISCTLKQPTDLHPGQVKALGNRFLSDVVEIIKHGNFSHQIDVAGCTLCTVSHVSFHFCIKKAFSLLGTG